MTHSSSKRLFIQTIIIKNHKIAVVIIIQSGKSFYFHSSNLAREWQLMATITYSQTLNSLL